MNNENKGGRFRRKRVDFSIVSNDIIRNPNISLRAKGLYTLIQSYITLDDFVVYKGFLQSKCSEGKKAFESAWKELKDTGYLLQYRMQDEKKHFYYEYELLDTPISQNGVPADNLPVPPKGYTGKRSMPEKDITLNGSDIINTIKNNSIGSNTNQIISFNDTMRQIGYTNEMLTDEVENIITLMTEVYNMNDDAIVRINQQNMKAIQVKERFRKIRYEHIDYITLVLNEFTGDIRNIRSFMLTTIFNSVATCGVYFRTRVNHDMYRDN